MNTPDLRVERVRHPLKLRQLTVTRVEPLAGGLLARITVQGDDLQDFVTASFDDHVKIFFAPEPGQPVALPEIGPDGARFREDAPRPAARDYTATGRPAPGPPRRNRASRSPSPARAALSWCRRRSTGMC